MKIATLITALAMCGMQLALAQEPAKRPPDRIFVNGRVWTGLSTTPYVEAIAVSGERILATGTSLEIRRSESSDTQVVDLQGAFVVPGFIDNHVHFINGGLALAQIDLRDAKTPKEFAQRIAAAARARRGQWITDGSWDHELWGGMLPTRHWIDDATPDTPVLVSRLDGHMALANSVALERARITAATPDPAGGTIVRDAKGEPTGILKDTALDLVLKVIPPPSAADIDAALERASLYAVSRGVTQVHDMGMGAGEWQSLEACQRALAGNRLRLRIYSFVALADFGKMTAYVGEQGAGSDWLRWGALKGFVDGSLGSTTAWFHEPYTDAPGTRGLIMMDPAELRSRIRQADRAQRHLAVHAIGDHANDWLLDTFEASAKAHGPRDRRLRIEHAQHLTAGAIARLKPLNVIASMQPYHAIDDGRWAEKRIGPKRLQGTYAFRSILDSGARLTFGSDWPVAPIDPLIGIYAAVTRRTIDGANPHGWQPQQRITVEEALRAYTSANAYAGFQENAVGSIAAGFLADFVVLDEDLFKAEPVSIPEIKVLRTVIGGRDAFVQAFR